MKSTWIGSKGISRLHSTATRRSTISPRFVEIMNWMDFIRLSYILRPSRTDDTIVAKLSSASTTSAASFATSVPVIPIATPILASFSAGASLTPSPVIATTLPLCWKALTMRTLCSGATRAKTEILPTISCSFSSERSSTSVPVSTASCSCIIPNSRAMADAVILWSPVIITGLIPALRHWATATFASSRGGSIIPTIPRNMRSDSIVSVEIASGSSLMDLLATARTRNALDAICILALLIFCISASVICLIPLRPTIPVQHFSRSSRPPLTATRYPPSRHL